ncbi:beta-fructosidase [Corynebacterium yudongzhengii]|uniref:beta-fructofuranosidase n=1 Tax=Corynebacterium yudongzhengii TaxID=2080740 RepID=A0A2U1T9J9_9CORY|nr:GH32 C-terminal domain-containing protein [Corynebacterium yudongzhengii]AWB82158.1 beta-fructosidase [Corynebacterium yudongzhengii]PWC02662.1 beta-fructosidase [Corynebacterium yudongzhengii]
MPVPYRPELHVTAEIGVLNAPAGVLRDGDAWHVFYQFQPQLDAPPRWGHVVSDDGPFDWSECDDALAPEGEEIAVRAGAVVATQQGADLYFTSVTDKGTSVEVAHIESVEDACEVSDDPSLLDASVARAGTVVDDRDGFYNFRSPCVVPGWQNADDRDAGHAGWLMLAVTGATEDPQPVILHSDDGRDWHVTGALTFSGDHGLESTTHLVAPRFLRLRDEVDGEIYDVLLITIENDGQDISGYLVGTLEGANFEVVTGFTRIDHGYDFTRPRTANITQRTLESGPLFDEAVIFGLLNRAGRADDPSQHLSIRESDWANVLSLPRVLSLQGGRIFQPPRSGVLDAIHTSHRARSWIGLCEIPHGGEVHVDLRDTEGNIAFSVTHRGTEVIVDRTMNPLHSDEETASAPVVDSDSQSLSIFVDGSTVEVFVDGGEAALASRAYIVGGEATFEVTTSGGAKIERAYEHSPHTADSNLLADLQELADEDGLFSDGDGEG